LINPAGVYEKSAAAHSVMKHARKTTNECNAAVHVARYRQYITCKRQTSLIAEAAMQPLAKEELN